VRNVQQDLGKDNVTIEVVAYGPGIGMLKLESVVGPRVADALASGVAVVACENTMKNQKLSRDDMLSKIGYVDAGVVELMKRQKEGYAYIRP
jgi:intracellular sulfur oxidation DsrE/DsrF family protein